METEMKEILQSIQGIAPDVFDQVVRWGIISNIIGFVFAVTLIATTWIVVRIVWQKTEDGDEARVLALIVSICVAIIAILGSIISAYFVLQAWLAPYAYFVGKLNT